MVSASTIKPLPWKRHSVVEKSRKTVGKMAGSTGMTTFAILMVVLVANVQAVPISGDHSLTEQNEEVKRVARSVDFGQPLNWDDFQDSNLKIWEFGIPVGTTGLADIVDDDGLREATGEGWEEKFQEISENCGNVRSFNGRRCAWDHLVFMNRELEKSDADFSHDELTFAYLFKVCEPLREGGRAPEMRPHCFAPCAANPCDGGSYCRPLGQLSGQSTCVPIPTRPRPPIRISVNARPFRPTPTPWVPSHTTGAPRIASAIPPRFVRIYGTRRPVVYGTRSPRFYTTPRPLGVRMTPCPGYGTRYRNSYQICMRRLRAMLRNPNYGRPGYVYSTANPNRIRASAFAPRAEEAEEVDEADEAEEDRK